MFLLYHSARSDALLQEAYGPPFEPLFGPLSEAGAGPLARWPHAHRLVQGSWLGLSLSLLHDLFLTNLPEHTNTQQQ